MIAAPVGVRSLVADLAAAGVPGAVRLDALAGDFDVGRGDPKRLAGRAPAWIADAAAVRAYDVLEPVLAPPPAPRRPSVYLVGEPSARQRDALAALRRLIDDGHATSATGAAVARAAKISRRDWPDIMRGLEDRGLANVLDGVPPLIVLGPRANLYPDRTVPRTQRSHQIEAHLRAGLEVDAVLAAVTPRPTRQEVLRVRALHCPDLPSLHPALVATGENHAKVVAAYVAGERNLSRLGRAVGVSRVRVVQILDNARSRGELPGERA